MSTAFASRRRLSVTTLVLAAVLASIAWLLTGASAQAGSPWVAGAGRTIIEGGTGGTAPVPVTTIVALHATASGGHFECLALAPGATTGPGSGQFTTNVMYVTGPVTSVTVDGDRAVVRGWATVTGLGAGQHRAFTAVVREGGPGATVVLTVSGLTFHETLLDGHITVG